MRIKALLLSTASLICFASVIILTIFLHVCYVSSAQFAVHGGVFPVLHGPNYMPHPSHPPVSLLFHVFFALHNCMARIQLFPTGWLDTCRALVSGLSVLAVPWSPAVCRPPDIATTTNTLFLSFFLFLIKSATPRITAVSI